MAEGARQLKPDRAAVVTKRAFGQADVIRETERASIAPVGSTAGAQRDRPHVAAAAENGVRFAHPYKLASRQARAERTVVDVSGVQVGNGELVVIAGPCSVESREQLLTTAYSVKAAGARLLRGGAYKPRTSPYDFQGLGVQGLKLLAEARSET